MRSRWPCQLGDEGLLLETLAIGSLHLAAIGSHPAGCTEAVAAVFGYVQPRTSRNSSRHARVDRALTSMEEIGSLIGNSVPR